LFVLGAVDSFPAVETVEPFFDGTVTVAEEPVFTSEVPDFETEGPLVVCEGWFAVCCGWVSAVLLVVGDVYEEPHEFC
jgi:hypothetical protein